MTPILLDTCAAIWLSKDAPVREAALSALDEAAESDTPVFVSPISAWELGMLVSRNRLDLLVTPERWFDRLLSVRGVQLAEMSPDVLIASSFLPGKPPRDPSNRIIAATARDLGAMLITRDRPLLAYSEQGHLNALAC